MTTLHSANAAAVRRWRPPVWHDRRVTQPDGAAQALQSYARRVQTGFVRLGLSAARLTCTPVQHAARCSPAERLERAWRLRFEGHEIWCIADDVGQRALLGCILGSVPSNDLTSIERSIVAESICRLLALDGIEAGPEEAPARLAEVWSCDADIVSPGLAAARLLLCTAILKPQATVANAKVELGQVPLRLRAALPGLSVRLGDVLGWAPGSSVPLRCEPAALVAAVYVGARRLGSGTLGSVLGERALRLTALRVLQR